MKKKEKRKVVIIQTVLVLTEATLDTTYFFYERKTHRETHVKAKFLLTLLLPQELVLNLCQKPIFAKKVFLRHHFLNLTLKRRKAFH